MNCIQKKKLVVIFKNKDELAFNYIKKLIEADDDNKENNEIVGSEDGTISVIGWTEKVYLDNVKKKTLSNRAVFLDDVKGVDKVLPILDKKFDRFGISYGFAGKKAVISINENKIKDAKTFNEMKSYFEDYFKGISPEYKEDSESNLKGKQYPGNARNARIAAAILAVVHPIYSIPFVYGSIKSSRELRDVMFLYAINKFYLDELDAFMKD